VELTDAIGHRALAYVDSVERHGHRLTVEEFDAYVLVPGRMLPQGAVEAAARQIRRAVLAAYLTAAPRETVLGWLERLRWLREDGGHVLITPLGRAVLAALEEAGREDELPTELVLSPSDELSYARLIGSIAAVGKCALVDGYFTVNSLLDVVQRTDVQRILVRPDHQKTGRNAALAQGVAGLRIDRPFEIRIGDQIHDRFVIPASGPVRFIGTSLSGVGRRVALTGQIGDEATSNALRDVFEEAWSNSEVLAKATLESATEGDVSDATVIVGEAAATNGGDSPSADEATDV
jgi:hypothetical protein